MPSKNFLFINKPTGWTSFDVVAYVRGIARRQLKQKNIKVGHAGTLDPFATGLLIVGVGRAATKRLDEFKTLPKTYLATITLGAVSDTFDLTGCLAAYAGRQKPPRAEEIRESLKFFLGKQLQTPPMFSAKKIAGQKLYTLARQGETIERTPAPIEIYALKLLDYIWPALEVEITCSAGTYIRSLAHDLGQKLGVGAYCSALTRTKIGPFTLAMATAPQAIDRVKAQNSRPVDKNSGPFDSLAAF